MQIDPCKDLGIRRNALGWTLEQRRHGRPDSGGSGRRRRGPRGGGGRGAPLGGLGSRGDGARGPVRGEGRPVAAMVGEDGAPAALGGGGRAWENQWRPGKLSRGWVGQREAEARGSTAR